MIGPLLVTVSVGDLLYGKPKDAECCAFARAIRRQVEAVYGAPPSYVSVSPRQQMVQIKVGSTTRRYALTGAADDFACDFDERGLAGRLAMAFRPRRFSLPHTVA